MNYNIRIILEFDSRNDEKKYRNLWTRYGKHDFAEASKNLTRYRSEN